MRSSVCLFAFLAALVVPMETAWAQLGGGQFGGGGGGQMGGVRIDKAGLLRVATAAERKERPTVPELPDDLAALSELRQVSLRAVAEEAARHLKAGEKIPAECELLAGLSAIEYIILDADNKDIRLAGPAEGWKLIGEGREIGRKTGRATIHLEDVATALRSVNGRWGEIMCSIDPRRDGLAAVQKVSLGNLNSKREIAQGKETVKDALGRQSVRTGGVPEGCRFARVMVEADYMMKQMAIGEVVVKGVSNHLDAVVEKNKRGDLNTGLARWWFVSDYAPMGANAARTVFRIQGPHIKLLNEEMLLTRDGSKIGKGDKSQPDQFSADFTAAFPDLETKFPSFSDLRNLYDLVLMATLLEQQGALDWLKDTVLLDEEAWPTPESIVPREAEPLAAFAFHQAKSKSNNAAYGGSPYFSIAYGGVSMRFSKIQFDTGKNITIDPAVKGPADSSKKSSDSKPSVASGTKKPTPGEKKAATTETKEKSWWVDLKPPEAKS